MALLARVVFATAAATTALGASGMVVAPHVEPPGTPVVHEHAVGALRFPVLLLGDAPGIPTLEVQSASAARHLRHIPLTSADGTPLATMENAHMLALLAGGAVLALFTFAISRLPRPSRHAIFEIVGPLLVGTQWLATTVCPPPRVRALAAA